MADLHKAKSLAVACAKFVMTKPEQEVDWAAMQQLHLVMAAVAEETRLAIGRFNQEKLRLQAFQSRGRAYDVDEQFITANVAVSISVRVLDILCIGHVFNFAIWEIPSSTIRKHP